MDLPDEPVPDDDEQWVRSLIFEHQRERQRVRAEASRMIDKIRKDPLGRSLEDFDDAPKGIPNVGWESKLDRRSIQVIGNLGQYFSSVFNDSKTSSTFNVGFYAGVLASKLELIDPSLFTHDSDNDSP